MPELPEIETIVRDLRPMLVGRRLSGVQRTSNLELRRPWDDKWPALLAGRRIEAVNRRGKWIVQYLDNGTFLVFHLGMSGQLRVVSASTPAPDHLHLVFSLDDGKQMRFRDPRRFGSVSLFAGQKELQALFVENGLGPEPFDLEANAWRRTLTGTTRAIKAVLTDQEVVAGLGNIYSDEVLFVAKLHPAKRASALTSAEADRVREAITEVLTTAIDKRGSSIRDYVDASGGQGGYQEVFVAYGRDGQPCSRCKTLLVALKVGGRTAHFCPSCQKTPPPGQAAIEEPQASGAGKPPAAEEPTSPPKAGRSRKPKR
jgi:formamidopyrimidine-DNA glycosylase